MRYSVTLLNLVRLALCVFYPRYSDSDYLVAFLIYISFVTVFSVFMIYRVVPTHGTRNPMVYLSICSLVGSVSVMAIKVSYHVSRTSVQKLMVVIGFWRRPQIDFCGKQSIVTYEYLCLRHCRCGVYLGPDGERFSQRPGRPANAVIELFQ